MKFWWVNQGKTFEKEVQGGYLWSPKVDSNGAFNYSYQTMTLVEPGDFIFSYQKSNIRAVGVVQRKVYHGPKPDFGNHGANWNISGWYVDVEFELLQVPISPRDFLEELLPDLPEKYSPILPTGKGNQKVYLVDIPENLASTLIRNSAINIESAIERLSPTIDTNSDYEINLEIAARGVKGNLEKEQLIMARRGQGIFRHNVRLIESRCRVTSVEDTRHLVASHIKPWKVSSDEEKINKNNGLMLAPHIDHLFDGGFITFKDSGELVFSHLLTENVLRNWHLPEIWNSGSFNSDQQYFMEFHRTCVFKR